MPALPAGDHQVALFLVAGGNGKTLGLPQGNTVLYARHVAITGQLEWRIPAPFIQRALMVWTGLFGVVSFELYGQLHQVVGEEPADRDAFFAECIRRWLDFMNLG